MVRVTPKRQTLSAWIEANICLPQGLSATLGPVKLFPIQRAIADALTDPKIETVGVQKAGRTGLSTFRPSSSPGINLKKISSSKIKLVSPAADSHVLLPSGGPLQP